MRIVALSDTHGYHKQFRWIPEGDLLIHAGDFSMRAQEHHVIEFSNWFNALPHKHKIIIPGNHDMACETDRAWAAEEFAPAIYLDHESCEVMGYKIFGSPYTNSIYEPSPWFFDYPRYSERSKELWSQIPENLDILITHGPPYMIADLVPHVHDFEDPHVGDANLLARVNQTMPRIHIFGHIHEGYGSYLSAAAKTRFYNVCICDGDYKPVNPMTVIDL
jgi:Icc-related predicted phosphoesterase